MKNKKVKFIVDAAVIAALYVVLTYSRQRIDRRSSH